MHLIIGLISLFLALQAAPALAQNNWREFRSDTDGFSIMLPETSTVSARRIGTSEATQTMFLIERGRNAYLVSVIQLAKDTGPKKPDNAYFQNLMKNYAEGSKTTLRTSRMTTLAGKPAMEGITDAAEAAHLVDLTAVGDRVFMVVYVGPKGEEKGPVGLRFRDSFKLLN
jgi:hypothetical protein